jgi:predicted amidohydrolase YtcJ
MGITDEEIAVYRDLARSGRLPLRVYAYLAGAGRVDSLASRTPDADPEGTARFVLRGVKLFADGALGSRGAALLAPYADAPSNSGLLVSAPAHIQDVATRALRAGFQVNTHAIGDRGNRLVLDAYEKALAAAQLAVGAMSGTAATLRAHDLDTLRMRRRVTSPGGTTARGLAALERGGVRSAFADAIDAAAGK